MYLMIILAVAYIASIASLFLVHLTTANPCDNNCLPTILVVKRRYLKDTTLKRLYCNAKA